MPTTGEVTESVDEGPYLEYAVRINRRNGTTTMDRSRFRNPQVADRHCAQILNQHRHRRLIPRATDVVGAEVVARWVGGWAGYLPDPAEGDKVTT